MDRLIRVLFVENAEQDILLIENELEKAGFRVEYRQVASAKQIGEALADQSWDLLISDSAMPLFAGLRALEMLKTLALDLPVIITTRSIEEEQAIAAIKAGARDVVAKDNLSRLVPIVERELGESRLRRQSRETEERLRRLAYYDSMTGLPNFNFLRERIENAILQNQSNGTAPFALLLMELDRFQEFHDTLGHQLAERFLKEIGPRLKTDLPDAAVVACLRSHEFAIFLPSPAGADDAVRAVRQILIALERPFVLDDVELEPQARFGVAVFPQHGTTPNALMQRAHIALSAAKRTYDRYAVFSVDQNETTAEEIALVAELRRAIAENELSLFYQPKVDLETRRVAGVEALVRWKHPQRGLIPPQRFIPLAERTGLIMPLTQWVIRAALGQWQNWKRQNIDVKMAVNLSMWNLQAEELPDQIAAMLAEHQAQPDHLMLEITESAIMANPSRAMERVTRMRQMGLRFSIDDFGTGYCSLSYLKKLPIDEIKIDQSFVRNMVSHEEDAAIVKLIVHLGHDLRLKLVAEGVEDRDTLNRLRELGCDWAQGYFICRPAPAAALTPRLKEPTWQLD